MSITPLSAAMQLVPLRHGDSEWSARNLFTGWLDVPLSLADVTARLLPYWCAEIVPDLLTGHCVLVVSHGNTLTALIKHLNRVGDEQSGLLEVPAGIPVSYELDRDMRPVTPGGERLGTRGRPAQ